MSAQVQPQTSAILWCIYSIANLQLLEHGRPIYDLDQLRNDASPVRKATEQKHGVNKPKTGLAEPGLMYKSPGPLEQVEIDNCSEIMKRLKYRFPRGREARVDAENLCWRQLCWEHLPVPNNDRALIEALGARWVELATMVDREAPTAEENQRVRTFLREFLILACAPESAPVPSESEVM